MKICFISPYPPKKNAMTSAAYLKQGMDKIEKVDVFKWNFYNKFSTTLAPIYKFLSLVKLARSYDIIHIQYDLGGYMPFFLPFLGLAKLFGKAKIIITSHEKLDNIPLSALLIMWHNFFYNAADHIIVHTKEHKRMLPENLRNKCSIIPHGVISREVQRNPLPKTILLAGFINKWKGHDVAIKAMKKVAAKFPDSRLWIVGKPHDKEFSKETQELSLKLGLKHNVEFYLDYIPEDKFLEFFRNADITILPYSRITMSGILAHVISWKIPAVMSNLEPFREYTKDKAVYFRVGNHNDLADKMIKIINNSRIKEKMSKDFAELEKEYSWDNVARQTYELYKKLAVKVKVEENKMTEIKSAPAEVKVEESKAVTTEVIAEKQLTPTHSINTVEAPQTSSNDQNSSAAEANQRNP